MPISPQQCLLLRPPKGKTLLLLAASLALTSVGVLMIADTQGNPDGFVACTLFRRWPLG